MKKSEIYHEAQRVVLLSDLMTDTKLAIIKQLSNDEDTALYTEELEEKRAKEAEDEAV